MQFYIYDFSEYVDCDVEADGLFPGYPLLENYWTEPGERFPYLVKSNEKFIGFALIRILPDLDNRYSIGEFFIMKKYRRSGIGSSVALELFARYKGLWEVHQRTNNIPAQAFWIKVIDLYTKGQYTDEYVDGKRLQLFSSL